MGIEDRQTLRARNRAVGDTRLSSMEQGGKRGGKGRRSLGISDNKRQKLGSGDVKVGSGRRAAQNHNFDETKMNSECKVGRKEGRMAVVHEKECKSEKEALEQTRQQDYHGKAEKKERRRIQEFAVVDGKGNAEPLESLSFLSSKSSKKLVLAGVVYPVSGPMNKSTGRRIKKMGPIVGYSVELKGSSAQVVIETRLASYVALRPTAGYKKCYENLAGQAAIAFEVVKALDVKCGGNSQVRFEEVIARLARSKVTREFSSSREGLLINGKFILDQLKGMNLDRTSFYTTLEAEVSNYMYVGAQRMTHGNGIVIQRDEGSHTSSDSGQITCDAQELADQQYAMQLQAKIDREMNNGRAHATGARESQAYIKVSEEEIADDYPLPQQYVKEEEEMDEFVLYDEELEAMCPEDLPKRVLTDYSIYNGDGFLTSLELLPMWSGVDPDVELYASGLVIEEESSDFQVAADEGSSSGSGSKKADQDQKQGMRMSLSQIREWVVELGPDMVFISLRTDIGWYNLSTPSQKYKPWASVVLRCAHVAAKTLQLICEKSRASKLSFGDIVKKLCADEPASKTFISNKPLVVERFLSVHAQILLSCYQHFPIESVRKCSFVLGLKEKLNTLKHSKLYVSSSRQRGRGLNRNPMKDRAAGVRSKPMTATATAMVKSVWQAYFTAGDSNLQAEVAHEVEEDENEENEDEATETALARAAEALKDTEKDAGFSYNLVVSSVVPKAARKETSWTLVEPLSKRKEARLFQKAQSSKGHVISLGECVKICGEDTLGVVQAIWDAKGKKKVQIRVLKTGYETVLGDAASDEELFLSSGVITYPIMMIEGKVNATRRLRKWDTRSRIEHFMEDAAIRQENETVKSRKKGSLTMFWCKEYVPEEGMFRDAPKDLRLGTILKDTLSDEDDQIDEDEGFAMATNGGVLIDGTQYKLGQCMYVHPDVFDQMPEAHEDVELPSYLANARFHKGSHSGLRAWGIGQLVHVGKKGSKGPGQGQEVATVVLKRFWRPEDISVKFANEAESYYHVYAGDEEIEVDVEDVVGPVSVGPIQHTESSDTFVCIGKFHTKSKKVKDTPKDFVSTHELKADEQPKPAKSAKAKGKAPVDESPSIVAKEVDDPVALATMDIFAGCGGLSEGMHQAKAAVTKWAIEYEEPAAESFKINNPDAAVFCDNCNVLLHAAMVKAGQKDDCMASEEAISQSEKLSDADKERLPQPGEVDFICGGPPCQGYSGMNRFNKGNWSMVQNSMVMAFLSYADFYRPRYFLLENVRNFVSHNKSFTFRLTLRSLLEMGYQVRFGVLNAGNFGVSQSRKRTFIWAAAPSENLPSWPRLMHCFRTPQLTIKLPGDVQYTAVPQTEGAPLRPVTVHDAISDLPPIANGHDDDVMKYASEPKTAFQIAIRGSCDTLYDHVSKYMNDLNMERCKCIPKNCPGADWRVLEEIVNKDPSKKLFRGQPLVPWCLPNTADRHNGWRGLFGRLDWRGHFPTSTTDPQPMGKVGQVFHPEQDRIVSVRECARAQGFPDRYRFVGSVQNKHRQVGNAVPPPLAAALGRELRRALVHEKRP